MCAWIKFIMSMLYLQKSIALISKSYLLVTTFSKSTSKVENALLCTCFILDFKKQTLNNLNQKTNTMLGKLILNMFCMIKKQTE